VLFFWDGSVRSLLVSHRSSTHSGTWIYSGFYHFPSNLSRASMFLTQRSCHSVTFVSLNKCFLKMCLIFYQVVEKHGEQDSVRFLPLMCVQSPQSRTGSPSDAMTMGTCSEARTTLLLLSISPASHRDFHRSQVKDHGLMAYYLHFFSILSQQC
jgi:hypothetical protein